MKLHRPYIPLAVRIQVAERQADALGYRFDHPVLSVKLAALIRFLFGGQKFELHHRPSLINRPFDFRTQDYSPLANDPQYLVYLPKQEHDIETRVRGVGAQRSDLSQRRYLKRVARNRDKTRKRHSWPKRKFRPSP